MSWILPTFGWPAYVLFSEMSGAAADLLVKLLTTLFLVGQLLGPYEQVLPLIVFDGNSLTSGYISGTDAPYPAQCAALLQGNVVVINKGQNSLTTPDMISRAPATIDVLFSDTRSWNVVVAWEGSNDLSTLRAPAATAQDHYKTYAAARRLKGWKVVMLSVLPRSVGAYQTPADFEARRQQFNAALRSDTTWLDGFVDIGADSILGEAGADKDSRYYSDGVHLTREGYGLVARAVAAELSRIGAVQTK